MNYEQWLYCNQKLEDAWIELAGDEEEQINTEEVELSRLYANPQCAVDVDKAISDWSRTKHEH